MARESEGEKKMNNHLDVLYTMYRQGWAAPVLFFIAACIFGALIIREGR
jgi:hypothetical protein